MLSKLLDRLEARYGRHKGIRNLMTIVVFGMAAVYLMDYIMPMIGTGRSMTSYLMFTKSAIQRGEIWRLITFVFVPDTYSNIIFFAISLYFYWLMGSMLQNHWGTLRFTLFYIVGMLGAVISGFITGYATSYYLNMSLMLAMACIYPDMELNLYGFLRMRLKWFALLSVAGMVLPMLTVHGWQEPVALAMALLNVLLFFADRLLKRTKQIWRHYQWKRQWRSGWKR
nr:rhomboid family intramembrane serine protease [Clostridia bacterium]